MLLLKKYTQNILSQQVKRVTCIFLASLLFNHTRFFAMDNNGLGTKAIGMANAFVAVSDNCWAINYNPAGLVKVNDFQCSAFIAPAQFGLQELKTTALAASAPLSFASIGMKAVKFGFDLYSEAEFGLAIAKRIDRNISTGLGFEYYRLDIARYGSAAGFFINGGLMAHIGEKIDVGFSVHNITAASIGRTKEKIPQVFTSGVCWSPLHDLSVSVEMEKDIHFPASIKMGIEQLVFSAVALRAGIANNPDKYSCGIGLRYSVFEFGYAAYTHPDLGWTHQVDISFNLE